MFADRPLVINKMIPSIMERGKKVDHNVNKEQKVYTPVNDQPSQIIIMNKGNSIGDTNECVDQ
jgi:hypothetical protein